MISEGIQTPNSILVVAIILAAVATLVAVVWTPYLNGNHTENSLNSRISLDNINNNNNINSIDGQNSLSRP
jgi:hypothetical protein